MPTWNNCCSRPDAGLLLPRALTGLLLPRAHTALRRASLWAATFPMVSTIPRLTHLSHGHDLFSRPRIFTKSFPFQPSKHRSFCQAFLWIIQLDLGFRPSKHNGMFMFYLRSGCVLPCNLVYLVSSLLSSLPFHFPFLPRIREGE